MVKPRLIFHGARTLDRRWLINNSISYKHQFAISAACRGTSAAHRTHLRHSPLRHLRTRQAFVVRCPLIPLSLNLRARLQKKQAKLATAWWLCLRMAHLRRSRYICWYKFLCMAHLQNLRCLPIDTSAKELKKLLLLHCGSHAYNPDFWGFLWVSGKI
jgi:hypothetical protein